MKKYLIVFASLVVLLAASSARAADVPAMPEALVGIGDVAVGAMQAVPADVDNPTAVEFTASTDHALVSSYSLDILTPAGAVLQTLDLGKPTPDANNLIHSTMNVQPIAFGVGYSVRVKAIASGVSSDYAVSQNKFNRKPGGPSKPIIK